MPTWQAVLWCLLGACLLEGYGLAPPVRRRRARSAEQRDQAPWRRRWAVAALRAGAACAVAAVIAATTGATAPGAFAVGVAVPLAIEQVVRVNQALGRR